jgi:hypothetical protein
MKWKGILVIGILASALFAFRPVSAGEPAHYLPGLFPIRFAALPPPGPYYLQFNFDYHIDASGKASKVLTIPGVEPPVELNVSADVDVDYDMIVVAPTGIWMTPLKLLQADYGIAFMLPLAYVDMDLEGSLKVQETSSGRSISREFERDDSQFNLGDVFFTPFLLGWHWPRFDLMALYGFHAPTGKYNSGDIDNTGLGFFEHQFQVGGIGYLDEGKSLGLQVLGTYELNHGKIDQDVTVGDYVTLEYGVSKVFKGVFEVGLRGYSMWQVQDDSGSDLILDSPKTKAHGIGGQISYTIPKWKLNIGLNYMQDIDNTGRPKAELGVLTFTKGF